MPNESPRGFGIDVGGSGVKGGIVNLDTGELIGDRIKILTPHPATPDAIAKTAAQIVEQAGWTGKVGVTLPSVVKSGRVYTAANIDHSWIGVQADDLFSTAFGGREVSVLNDADAAGLAEDAHGAGKDVIGVVLLLTFGTGIGSALINRGLLMPNTELGHMEVHGKEAEHRAASSVKDRKGLSYERWAEHVSTVLNAYENLFWPDLFIAGGGISRKSEKWIPHLTIRTPIVPATLLNTAGIVGAAMAAEGAAATPTSALS